VRPSSTPWTVNRFTIVGGAMSRWLVGGPDAIGVGSPVHPDARNIAAIVRTVDLDLILSPGTAVVRVELGNGRES
jgi:hypothetical protein